MTRKKTSKKRNRVSSYNTNNNENFSATAKSLIKGDNNNNHKIKGLYNLGNTCYFNSMLQMILHSPTFMVKLKTYCSTDYEMIVKTPTKDVKLILKTSDVSTVEQELIKIWESDCSSMSPTGLRTALLKNEQFRLHFNGFNEQDSHEAFLMTLNIIKDAQVTRIRKAILDYYDCRKETANISDDVKADIKTLGNLAGKLTLLHSHFGIVIGSALKCDVCGDMRIRFDECLHISPVFPFKSDADDVPTKKDETVIISNARNDETPHKLSKHQQKKQKRMERKAGRNKKSLQRNLDCSAEHEAGDVIIGPAQPAIEMSVVESSEPPSQVRLNPLMARFLGSADADEDNVEMRLEDFPAADEQRRPSSSCSKAAIGSNSSRSSSFCAQSMSQEEMPVEDDNDVIVEKFVTSLSIENDAVEHDDVAVENGLEEANNNDDDRMEGRLCGEQAAATTTDDGVQNMSDASSDAGTASTLPPMRSSKMQSILSNTLESHQDRLFTRNVSKIAFESETDLDRALNKVVVPHFIENLVCDSCSQPDSPRRETDHMKMDIICHTPLVLPIYISRFKQISAKNRSAKNNQFYSYPFLLNLSAQCSKYANVSEEQSTPVIYRLYGMIEHIGARINSGHYISYVSHPRDADSLDSRVSPQSYSPNLLQEICHKHNQLLYAGLDDLNDEPNEDDVINLADVSASDYNWFRISDSHVEPVSSNVIFNCQAFMLFYIRIQ